MTCTLLTGSDGMQHVLNIFNFQNTEQTITVNLAESGITVPQTPACSTAAMRPASLMPAME